MFGEDWRRLVLQAHLEYLDAWKVPAALSLALLRGWERKWPGLSWRLEPMRWSWRVAAWSAAMPSAPSSSGAAPRRPWPARPLAGRLSNEQRGGGSAQRCSGRWFVRCIFCRCESKCSLFSVQKRQIRKNKERIIYSCNVTNNLLVVEASNNDIQDRNMVNLQGAGPHQCQVDSELCQG